MITRKKTTLFVLSTLTFSGLVLAQEESSGDAEVFMQSDGQEEFIEYRLEDGMNGPAKGLNGDDADDGFYVDYTKDEVDVDETASDQLSEIDISDLDNSVDSEEGSGGNEAHTPEFYRNSILELMTPDIDEQDEVVFESKSNPARLGSWLGVEDNIGHITRGVKAPGPETYVSVLEKEFDVLRRIREKKREPNNQQKKYPEGSQSGYKRDELWSKSNKHAENCDRGYSRDSGKCANSCRVEFIYNGGKSHGLRNPFKLYETSPQYARCEACGIWAGFYKEHGFYQKQLGNLKSGAPMFCDLESGSEEEKKVCEEKENIYSACNGMAVCSHKCWESGVTRKGCMECINSFCSRESGHPLWSTFEKEFVLCRDHKRCLTNFPPETFDQLSVKDQWKGRQQCWGTHWSRSRHQDVNKMDFMKPVEVCNMVKKAMSIPFPEWEWAYNNCTTRICTVEHRDFNPSECEDLKCIKECLNSNGASEACLACGACQSCNIKSLQRSGMFDRKKFKNEKNGVNPALIKYETYDRKNPWARKALSPMTPFRQAQLEKGNCKSCDLQQFRLDCRASCEKYEELRLQGHDRDTKEYQLAFQTCKSTRCVTSVSSACGFCLKKCEKQGKVTWTSSLGSSFWRANYDGWGCNLDCRPKTITQYTEFRGVDVYDEQVAGYTRAFDNLNFGVLDDDTIDVLMDWAKKGQKKF